MLIDNGWRLPGGVCWLRWRMTIGTRLYVGVALSCVALWAAGTIRWWSVRDHAAHIEAVRSVIFIALFFLIVVGAIILLDRRYRIGYDEAAVYIRPHGLSLVASGRRTVRVAFDEIVLVAAERSARSVGYANRFTPFEFAHVYSRDGDAGEGVFALVGAELYDEEFRALLGLIDERAPGTLDDIIREWLASFRRF